MPPPLPPAPFFSSPLTQLLQMRRKNTKIVTMAQGYILKTKFSRNEQRVQLRDLAIDKFEAALRSMPVLRPIYLVNLADLYRKAGRYADANEFYLAAMRSDPSDPSSLLKYAHFTAEQGNDALAKDYYQRALRLDPKYVACLMDYAMFLCQERSPEAMAEADKLLLQAVDVVRQEEVGAGTRSSVLHDYAVFCVHCESYDKADEYFAAAIAAAPDTMLYKRNYKFFLETIRNDPMRAAALGRNVPVLSVDDSTLAL
jgi:Tfp pilus assembly protein PilF